MMSTGNAAATLDLTLQQETRKQTPLEKFKALCRKHMVIYDDRYIDVIFGVIFANRLNSKPVWLYLISPPGGGKTEILQSLEQDRREIYAVSILTAQSLISGRILSKGEKDPSLLPKLDGKVLVIKDFTAMLYSKWETLSAILGQLRDAYDGGCRKVFGTGKETEYSSKFGIIAAVTPAIDKHANLLAPLGERFLMYRSPPVSREERIERAMAASRNLSVEETEDALNCAAARILRRNPKQPELPDDLRQELLDLAELVARARCRVERDRTTREPMYFPEAEIPTLLGKQFADLALGLAMAREKPTVTADEVKLVQKVGLDSIPSNQLRLLKVLLSFYPQPRETGLICKALRISRPWGTRWLEDFCMTGVVERIETNGSACWRLNDQDATLLRKTGGRG